MDSSSPPVTVVDRQLALSNRVWNVHFDHIRDGNGSEVENYITISAKDLRDDLFSGVTILPVVGESLGLLRSYRHPVDRWIWEIPRGFLDPGEEPAVAALRELEEESGLICDPDRLVPLGGLMPEASTIRGRGALFAAEDCRPGGRRQQDEPGLGQLHLIPKQEVWAMLMRFEIEEACSLITLYRYFSHVSASGLKP